MSKAATKYKVNILIGLSLLSFYNCNGDNDSNENGTMLFWNQTKCADPWNTGENSSNVETELAVKEYLKGENIDVLNVGFDSSSPLDFLCESCGCGTGLRIIVEVKTADVEKMQKLEFYQ